MEPLPIGVRQPPAPPRPPAPPTTGGGDWGGEFFDGFGPLRVDSRHNFVTEVLVEIRKVAWPSRNELLHNAAVLIGVLALLIGGIAATNAGMVTLLRAATGGG